MSSPDTARIARAYFDAWTSGAGADALRPLMSPDFAFDAGGHVIEGRERFLAAGGWPEHATTTLLAAAYDGEHAFQLYSAVRGDVRVKIAEHLIVRDDVIVSSEVVVDGAAFAALMTGAA
jgi:hypothetical protein